MSGTFKEPDPSIPDHIPEDVLATYERSARRRVRTARFKARRRARAAIRPIRDGAMWVEAVVIFFWTVLILGVVGGIALALYTWPVVAGAVVGSTTLLFGSALWIAAARRRARVETLSRRGP